MRPRASNLLVNLKLLVAPPKQLSTATTTQTPGTALLRPRSPLLWGEGPRTVQGSWALNETGMTMTLTNAAHQCNPQSSRFFPHPFASRRTRHTRNRVVSIFFLDSSRVTAPHTKPQSIRGETSARPPHADSSPRGRLWSSCAARRVPLLRVVVTLEEARLVVR